MPRVLLALIAAIAVALAGCSTTESKNDYVDTVNGINSDVDSAITDATSGTGTSNAQIVEALRTSETALADAVDQLNDVEVPEEATGSHEDLVAGVDKLRALVAKTADQVEDAQGAESIEALTDLATQATKVDTQIREATSRINQDLGAE